jgi:hypothetical protein
VDRQDHLHRTALFAQRRLEKREKLKASRQRLSLGGSMYIVRRGCEFAPSFDCTAVLIDFLFLYCCVVIFKCFFYDVEVNQVGG